MYIVSTLFVADMLYIWHTLTDGDNDTLFFILFSLAKVIIILSSGRWYVLELSKCSPVRARMKGECPVRLSRVHDR